jgi:hypothetical protein
MILLVCAFTACGGESGLPCRESIASYCSNPGVYPACSWEAYGVPPAAPINGWLSTCGSYNVAASGGPGTETTGYYAPDTNLLIAVVVHEAWAPTVFCLAGPDRYSEPSCH